MAQGRQREVPFWTSVGLPLTCGLTMAIVAGLSWWHAPFWHTMPDGPRAVGPGYYWGSADRPGPAWPWLLVPLSGFVALLLTLIGVAWFLGRSVLKPLAAMRQADRQIAA